MNMVDLFAGIGGFSLGCSWAGFTPVLQVENDAFCNAVLAKHFPGVARHGDINTLSGEDIPPALLWCGGFPCQDISIAGGKEGIHGSRSNHFFQITRLLCEARTPPRYVLLENSPNLLAHPDWMAAVVGELAGVGLFDRIEWAVISAQDMGAPHLRKRIWILAYADTESGDERARLRKGQPEGERGRRPANLDHQERQGAADAHDTGRAEQCGPEPVEAGGQRHVEQPECDGGDDVRGGSWRGCAESIVRGMGDGVSPWVDGPTHTWWDDGPPLPFLGGDRHKRPARLMGLGNAVVPPLVATLAYWIRAHHEAT
jgi:DNA (cytosine-5)-methyltransferase 1